MAERRPIKIYYKPKRIPSHGAFEKPPFSPISPLPSTATFTSIQDMNRPASTFSVPIERESTFGSESKISSRNSFLSKTDLKEIRSSEKNDPKRNWMIITALLIAAGLITAVVLLGVYLSSKSKVDF